MPQFGSSKGLISQNISQTMDNQGNPIISSDTTFGASPLGYAARVQALFGLPNATFELTPPDTTLTINEGNQLPYWDIQEYSEGVMKATSVYDATTNSWGVKLDPGTATTNDYLTMTTRSYLVNDDNLSLRQKALAVVAKNGTYAGTTQWNLKLVASYYDQTDTLLHSGTVATILDNATWTSMSGTTTTGGTAINAAAHYVDLIYTLTATAPVTSATSVTIKSTLLQTSSGAGGGSQSFIVKETFTSSQTWTVPTGVTQLISVVAYGAGGGGAGGNAASAIDTNQTINGSQGGGGGALVAVENLDITGVGSVVVTVGAGGSGGAGKTFNKARGSSTELLAGTATAGTNGSAGGATSFGGYLSIGGGGGGTANVASATNTGGTPGVGTTTYFPGTVLTGGGSGTRNSGGASFVAIYNAALATGATGGSCTFSGGQTGTATAAGGTSFFGYGGRGGASSGVQDAAPGNGAQGTAGIGGAGGAGGSGGRAASSGTVTITVTGGNGGAGTAGGGGGGGGGVTASAFSAVYSNTIIALTAGTGGTGGNGFVVITYVG